MICGVGGSARGAQALYNHMNRYSKENNRYECAWLKEIFMMLEKDPGQLSRQILKIAPERIHTLLPGMAVLRAVSDFYGAGTVITSPHGVREGYLYHLLEERGVLDAS
ncbi:hypothetical protein SDC9_154704 [bioreactor metagenome]|uniref:Ppx/GppA phosphatase N-terminal domain-containing protein n=1 Tax=bioreactor metagenome TaxID=1076179 RepID=A0A645F496_9ZZZZ